jgi:hypothetical protein
MKSISSVTFALCLLAGLFSCGGKSEGGNGTDSTKKSPAISSNVRFEKNGLTVYALEDSPTFPEATLALDSPPPGVDPLKGKNKFQFSVSGFTLKDQTSDAAGKGLANSKDGQHIHFILDNEPYHAHYGAEVEADLKAGQHVLIAFLSRSYHESVKGPKAYVLRQFIAGAPEELVKEQDLTAPHLFYSRPKGEYFGEDTKKLLLDFYLVNCDLSDDGFKVRATINGTEFMFTKWLPYIIEGLPMGEVKIKLELLDATGNLVNSPFNGTERITKLMDKKPA